jgi:hypothetical protein
VTRDPERLLSVASEADAFERELLASLRDEHAPASVRRGAWQGIAAALVAATPGSAAAAGAALTGSSGAALSGSSAAAGVGTVAGGSVAPAAAAVGGKLAVGLGTKAAALLITKWALAGAIGAGAVGGAYWAVEHRGAGTNDSSPQLKAATPASAAPSPQPQRAAEPTTAQPERVAPAPAAVAPPPSAAERASNKHARLNALSAESNLLQNARAELRRGNLAEAEQALERLSRRFPRGVLNQERDVLRIELMSARGDEAGARRLATRFLRAHPESPHAARLRPLAPAP